MPGMDDSNVLTPPFTARLDAKPKRAREPSPPPEPETQPPDEVIAQGNAYATVHGQRIALNLEFIWRDGTSVVMPYACLPLLWWNPPRALVVEYRSALCLMLQGITDIGPLKRLIQDQRVTWIRECGEAEAAALPLAITSIALLDAYPSAEPKRHLNWKT
jgi:hypothetical protein